MDHTTSFDSSTSFVPYFDLSSATDTPLNRDPSRTRHSNLETHRKPRTGTGLNPKLSRETVPLVRPPTTTPNPPGRFPDDHFRFVLSPTETDPTTLTSTTLYQSKTLITFYVDGPTSLFDRTLPPSRLRADRVNPENSPRTSVKSNVGSTALGAPE